MDFGFSNPFDNPFHRDPVYLEGIDRSKKEEDLRSRAIKQEWDQNMNRIERNYIESKNKQSYNVQHDYAKADDSDTEEDNDGYEINYSKYLMKVFKGDRGVFFMMFIIFIIIVHVIISNYKVCKKHALIEITS